MKQLLIFITVFLLGCLTVHGQEIPLKDQFLVRGIVYNGDTIPYYQLPVVSIVSKRSYKSYVDQVRYEKLVRNVKKAYPYAKIAGDKFKEYEKALAQIPSKQHKAYMKKAEDEIKAGFESDLRKLTFSQGKILIKLVDRQAGQSSYALVQDLRGNFSAFCYQSLGRLFGYNLKTRYDLSKEENVEIEQIVQMIERGDL